MESDRSHQYSNCYQDWRLTADNFGVGMLRDELVSGLVPKQIAILMIDTTLVVLQESDKYKLLNQYLNSPPSYSKVLRWVHQMGFKRDTAKKSSYVDGHERPEQQHHRS
jgi:hypothetical protein